MSNLILQTSIYLINALSVHTALSPPNPPVQKHECCSGTPETDTLFEQVVQHITFLSKSTVWFSTSLSIIGTLTSQIRIQSSTPQISIASGASCTSTSTSTWSLPLIFANPTTIMSVCQLYKPHPLLIFGASLTFLSALLRLWCYRTLGPLFTFEITIRPKHSLIQHGPYSYVRHPSYTGVYLTLIGATFVLISPRSWTMTSSYGIRHPLGMFLFGLWIFKCFFAFRGMGVRLRAEDELLRNTFGNEWDEYAKRVPWKFVPWIY